MIDVGLVGYYGGKNVEQMLSTYMISKLLYNRESIPLPVGIVNYKKRHFKGFFSSRSKSLVLRAGDGSGPDHHGAEARGREENRHGGKLVFFF